MDYFNGIKSKFRFALMLNKVCIKSHEEKQSNIKTFGFDYWCNVSKIFNYQNDTLRNISKEVKNKYQPLIKQSMKQLMLIMSLALSINAYSQDDKTVTLLVSGQGKTQDEAKQNALRNAIEQAFGTFISSKTEILNDNLVKDEIISVANGNIQKFEIISEVQFPNGDYAISLKATVSVTKLTSFVESKGEVAEFKGSLFEFNIKQQILMEENEAKAVGEITSTTLKIMSNSLYGRISPREPYLKSGEIYSLPFVIEIHANNNINTAVKYFSENLDKLSLTNNQINDYRKLKKPIFEIIIVSSNSKITGGYTYKKKEYSICPVAIPDYNPNEFGFHSIFLRNSVSYTVLSQFIAKAYEQVFNFEIKTNNNLDLRINEINKLNCDKYGERHYIDANGTLPFTSDKIKYPLPVVIPLFNFSNPNQKCGFGYRLLPINKKVAQYLCERRNSLEENLLILLHQYEDDGLVYKLEGNFNIPLSDLGKMSSITINY